MKNEPIIQPVTKQIAKPTTAGQTIAKQAATTQTIAKQTTATQPTVKPSKFSEMKIHPRILQKLEDLKFVIPTPIQSKTIPIGLEGSDLIGIAQTGTGKTLAFAIPIIQKILEERKLTLIVLPTRELALQVDEVFQKVGRSMGINTAILIGGTGFGPQIGMIRRCPQIVIGTPGRIIDHMEKKNINLKVCKILVLDEADRMLDMGFAPQIKQILKELPLPENRQTMLFSATMPDDIAAIAAKHMRTPVRVEIARSGTVADNIEQEIFFVQKDQKLRLLNTILEEYKGPVLIFSRTKYGAKKICKAIEMMGHNSAEIHSNRSLFQRKEALAGFKSGKYRVLVATDIASRGIDVTGIELIVNYDLPEQAEDYVHRIGRTGRAGQKGRAISFATPDQKGKIRSIEILTKTKLKVSGEAPQPTSRPRYQPHPQSRSHSREYSRQPAQHRSQPHSQSRSHSREYSRQPTQHRSRSPSGSHSRTQPQSRSGSQPGSPSRQHSLLPSPARPQSHSQSGSQSQPKNQGFFKKRHFGNKQRFGK